MKNTNRKQIRPFLLAFFAPILVQSVISCGRRPVPDDKEPVDLTSSPIGRGFMPELPQMPPPQLTPPELPGMPAVPPAFNSPEVPNPQGVALTDLQIDMIKYVNRTRMARDLKPLVVDPDMTKDASAWATHFANLRSRNRLAEVPYSQNVCAPAINPGDAVAKWLNNPDSQTARNIMNPNFTKVGAGMGFTDTGYGYMFFQ
ncbi:MAG: Cysteine-rich secretory protein family [Pseudomonadota bacterium]|jgi:uncharacterized protein YkwD